MRDFPPSFGFAQRTRAEVPFMTPPTFSMKETQELLLRQKAVSYEAGQVAARAASDAVKNVWIVISEDDFGALTPATRPLVHETRERAEAEAERLAKLYPGKTFNVFRKATAKRVPAVSVATVRF